MNMYEIRSIDLKQVPGNDFIKFLRIEIPERRGYGPARFARVRYALNGDHIEEENGLPMDLGKEILLQRLRMKSSTEFLGKNWKKIYERPQSRSLRLSERK